jgi:hypothetical protein
MKFLSLLALTASVNSVSLVSKSATKQGGDISVSISQDDLMDIMSQIE